MSVSASRLSAVGSPPVLFGAVAIRFCLMRAARLILFPPETAAIRR
jgi:hypothetical protein